MASSDQARKTKAVLRVCLDVNIWVANQIAIQNGRRRASASALIDLIREGQCAAGQLQLVMSWEMISTLEKVLVRLRFDARSVTNVLEGIIGMMRFGPEPLDPHLLPEGGGHLAMRDIEDGGVLASSIATRVNLLITNNLDDFAVKDSERIDTRRIVRPEERIRPRCALAYERNDGVQIVIAHPFDALEWLKDGLWPSPEVSGLDIHAPSPRGETPEEARTARLSSRAQFADTPEGQREGSSVVAVTDAISRRTDGGPGVRYGAQTGRRFAAGRFALVLALR